MRACRLPLGLANRHAPEVRYIQGTGEGIFMIDTFGPHFWDCTNHCALGTS